MNHLRVHVEVPRTRDNENIQPYVYRHACACVTSLFTCTYKINVCKMSLYSVHDLHSKYYFSLSLSPVS